MKRVAILTDFYEADSSYSLNIIIEEQLGMLLRHGYAPVAVVEDIFQPVRVWQQAELRHIPHGIPRSNEVQFYDGWQDSVRRFREALETCLAGVDVVLTHDLIYQPACLWHNFASREYARDHPAVGWLNWVHSATASQVWTSGDGRLAPVQRHMPRSKTVYPNAWSVPRVAANFRCQPEDVAVVPHPTDAIGYLGLDGRLAEFVRDRRLLEAEAILIYPCRLDRGKQVEYVLRTAAALKRLGRSVRAVVVDFHSTGGDKVAYRDELRKLAVDLGLNEVECSFLSDHPEWRVRAPREVVRGLFQLSNVFVMPSVSETYSLVAQEAALCGNFLVLNFDFPPMRDVYGPHAAYFKFSSNVDAMTGLDGDTRTTYADVDGYFHGVALRVAYELDHNPVLAQKTRVRRERNPDFIFERFIEPLLASWDG